MDADEQETQRISAFLGYVLGLETDETRTRHLEPEQLKQQIFLAAEAVIRRRLDHSPLLLLVEDLHWTDAASIELLRYLVDRLPDRQFMLLVSHRPTAELEAFSAEYDGTHCDPARAAVFRPQHDAPRYLVRFVDATPSRRAARAHRRACRRQSAVHRGNGAGADRRRRAGSGAGKLELLRASRRRAGAAHHPRTPAGAHRPAAQPARQAIQEAAVIGPVFGEQLLRQVATDPGDARRSARALVGAGLVSEHAAPAAAGPWHPGPTVSLSARSVP